VGLRAMFRKVDFIQQIPTDLLVKSGQGGALSLAFMGLVVIILLMEVKSLWAETVLERVEVDNDFNATVALHLDITMLELKCEHLLVKVNDVMGNRIQGVDDLQYTEMSADGDVQAKYRRTDKAWLDKVARLGQDADGDGVVDAPEPVTDKELDSDWSSSTDGFQHKSFSEMIKFHDFHFVNFFAGWCSHCQHFSPTWAEMAKEHDMKKEYKDSRGNNAGVKFIKVNCVDFNDVCAQQQVRGYPELRFYTKDMNFRRFQGQRSKEALTDFLQQQVKTLVSDEAVAKGKPKPPPRGAKSVLGQGDEEHARCRIEGKMELPKVPGEFHIQATGELSNVNLNPELANLSHTVALLAITDLADTPRAADNWGKRQVKRIADRLPKDRADSLLAAVNPHQAFGKRRRPGSALLQQATFPAMETKTAPQHNLQVEAHEVKDVGRFYEYAIYTKHSASVKSLEDSDLEFYGKLQEGHRIPQAKFYYKIDPLVTTYHSYSKKWYDVLTKIISLVAAVYLLTMGANTSIHTIKKAMGMKAD